MKNSLAALAALCLAACASQGSSSPVLPSASAPNAGPAAANAAALPSIAHVTVVMMENRDYASVIGVPDAPYINKTLAPAGALLTNSHAVSHPSEPNYLAIFSGSVQGVSSDDCPLNFSAPNLGQELIAAGKTFRGYSESMPGNGYTGCDANSYARKHNPWVSFTNVPKSSNLVYHPNLVPGTGMADLTFVVPNLDDDMHDGTTQQGDTWLSKHLPQIIAWNAKNDGLLIVTWDEASPDNGTNPIATILVGPMVKPNVRSSQHVDHYTVTRTIEDAFGLKCTAQACNRTDISGIWN